ncbi:MULTISPECIES: hypothetical protein [unclassified Crossiella]|uniref:hypothetical protein n=1 Tax=unclassified Crossiella TaxID=2620835 RepID=UPI001FFFFA5F|nr:MULTISPECIES: hypothetical protein [unclassified Crossiella]MCK2245427.1 hypothetical protein [Crossiella sp. S99.2]MCK2259079.1 hypothetical protein [Crossiella sp. S99.1]
MTPSFSLVLVPVDIGYIRAVEIGLDLARSLGTRDDRVGFLDADALLCTSSHWRVLDEALNLQPELDAISGLVIHETCEIWETPSSAAFISALERSIGVVEKPYIQGGAGGTLARREVFERSVTNALELGTLIGPTLSATAVAGGRQIRATSLLPCRHTPRKTMEDWVRSVTAYERSWRKLVKFYGPGVEEPWKDFLYSAKESLLSEPALLRRLAYSQKLRQQIVTTVECAEGIR